MSKTIVIPEVSQDNRIGSVFNYLFYVINETESSEDPVVWDFSGVRFLHPFLIAPLSIYKHRSPVPIEIKVPSKATWNVIST